MLEELDIRDFAIAEHLRLHFHPGFNAITGETGAGKSIIIDALGLLLGDRPDPAGIRAGARASRVEGTFLVPETCMELRLALEDAGIELEDSAMIISRDVPRTGRSSARINGRSVIQSTLQTIGSHLVDIHSQTDQLAILRPSEHLQYLDRFAGALPLRASVAESVAKLRQIRSAIAQLKTNVHERARLQERLAYEIDEIDAAAVTAEEEEVLRAERHRLANAEQLAQLASSAYALLEGQNRAPGAVDLLGQTATVLSKLAQIDDALGAEALQTEALQSQAAEIARSLRAYTDDVEFSPVRLEQVEERLATIAALNRKYGPSVDAVLAYAEQARNQLAELETSDARLDTLAAEEEALLSQLSRSAAELSSQRREAARRLSDAVEHQMADLGLARGRFAIHFERRLDSEGVPTDLPGDETIGSEPSQLERDSQRSVGFDRTGIDRLEFVVTLNPGEPLRPLTRVASGGEMSRLLLALKTILGAADAVPTLVFDEVDVGVGGRSGSVIGEKLAALAEHHQVICITHLAQIASRADRHVAVTKQAGPDRTAISIQELAGVEREKEIAAMLGGVTAANRASARELLEQSS